VRHLPHPFHASCVTVLVRHGPLTRTVGPAGGCVTARGPRTGPVDVKKKLDVGNFFFQCGFVRSRALWGSMFDEDRHTFEHSPEHACLDSPLATLFDPPWRRAAWQAATDRFHEVIVTLESLEDTARSKDFFAVEKGGDEYQTLTAAQSQLEHSRWVPHRSHVQLSQPLPNLRPNPTRCSL
jgi:hypothetical protein